MIEPATSDELSAEESHELPRRPPPRLTLAEWATRTLQWIGPRRIVGSLAVAAGIGVGGWWLLHAPPPPVERSLPLATTTSVMPSSTTVTSDAPAAQAADAVVVVHVAGAVRRPGLVVLAATSRVADAVDAAGGAVADADVDALNLAAPLIDGSRIYVPRKGEMPPPTVVPTGVGGTIGVGTGVLVDINLASAVQLEQLPGVGPATASAIVAHREANGPFRTVDDLLDVRGIGPAKLEQFRALVTV